MFTHYVVPHTNLKLLTIEEVLKRPDKVAVAKNNKISTWAVRVVAFKNCPLHPAWLIDGL